MFLSRVILCHIVLASCPLINVMNWLFWTKMHLGVEDHFFFHCQVANANCHYLRSMCLWYKVTSLCLDVSSLLVLVFISHNLILSVKCAVLTTVPFHPCILWPRYPSCSHISFWISLHSLLWTHFIRCGLELVLGICSNRISFWQLNFILYKFSTKCCTTCIYLEIMAWYSIIFTDQKIELLS